MVTANFNLLVYTINPERKYMKSFKKYGLLALMIVVAGLSVFLPIYIWPKEVDMEFDGVMFNGEVSYSETVHIEITGHINRRLFGGTLFLGKIKLDGSGISDEFQKQTVQIKYNLSDIGVLKYLDESTGKMRLVEKGFAAMPLDVSWLIISLNEGDNVDDHKIEGSMIIAGPAVNRSEAVALANEIFDKLLEEPLK